jgi:hypothetical protein
LIPDTTLVPSDSIDVEWRIENLNSYDTCYIEKVDFYYTNFSGSAGLIKFATEYLYSDLPPGGSYQLTVRNFITPELNNLCIISQVYTDCCTTYAEKKHCVDIRRICPPDAITYSFAMYQIGSPTQIDILTSPEFEISWIYSIDWYLPDSAIVEITTDDESEMGTEGILTLAFTYDSNPPEYKHFKAIFTLNSGDANTDCVVNLGDCIYTANYYLKGGPAPDPLRAADVNCNCKIDLSDVIYLANYYFGKGPTPYPSEECECTY